MTAYESGSATAVVRLLVRLFILSVVLAALVGILALSGGALGAVEWRAIVTLVVLTVIGIAFLCCLAVAGTRYWVVGVLGALVLCWTGSYTLLVIWGQAFLDAETDTMVRLHTVGLILTIALAQIALLLGVAGGRPRLRVALWPTLTLSVAAAALAISLAVDGVPTTEGEYRTLVALAIFNALGTLTTLALALLGTRSREEESPPAARLSHSP